MRAVIAMVGACVLAACASGSNPGIGGGDDTPAADAPVPVCGDKVCAATEVGVCTADCGMPPPKATCGNQQCEPPTENSMTCPADCPASSSCNHNMVCDPTESTTDCADDCPPPAMQLCPTLFGSPIPVPNACKDCATGNLLACIALQKTQAECQMCVVQYCVGQMANGTCDADQFETPVSCVDCF